MGWRSVGTRFRGDIQGLRAVAVLAVVAAHAGVPFLPGGFVGVDVFFVISGFLISGLLFREVSEAGRVSLASFWSRRARRILPAATVVTLVTVAVAVVGLSLIDARQVVVDAIWSSLFAANVHFAQQDIYYFASGSGTSPLQHYWSLAVEEQFYVVWPLLLLALVGLSRIGRKGTTHAHLPRTTIAVALVLITATSFGWSLHQTAEQPGSAYFSTFTRAWELGVGGLAALVAVPLARVLHRHLLTVLGIMGVAAIVVACMAFTPDTAFPGYSAALPVLGTALLLVAGAGARSPATSHLLDNAPMRTLGDWSFSIYLWHWPALILSEGLLGRPLAAGETGLVVLAVLGLSSLTFHLVESPFRTGRPARALRVPRALALYPASLVLVGATCLVGWQWTAVQGGETGDNPPITVAGSHDDAVALVRASVDAARDEVAVPSDLTPDLLELRDSIADVGDCDYAEDVRALCPRGATNGERTLVVVGDSHARAWIPAFDRIAVEGDWTAYYLVKPQCTAAHVLVAPVNEARPFTECVAFQDWVIDMVSGLEPDLVVVASSPPVNGVYDGTARYEATDKVAPLLADGYDELFGELLGNAERVALLRDVPKSPDDPGTCLTQGDPSLGDCMFSPVERSEILADVAVQSAILTGAEVVDPTPWLCYEGDCPVVIGGTLSYRDTDHITTEYAASLAGALGRALDML
ncbi:acyltransferase [Nocardioides psychrotolerans]|uniref:Peptidoglycan/LPS O-acetylase OafA/YrhL, contains acyltransferase and SGNH-hydrolase domains n=1 Tax=Nocardioides psychrotolerans TaxID=1005945 RepID=A0A1I3BG50_9ACTN|nr:acyltransferase family protein [Nocardioides psychrotolerans]GEP36655.1 acyltransferase [Nocardioides psychrotolerans]SFH61274.1 Peptidoglycan/LPS O-acetylase OafA/YrhL, contains acyltransferase and SGNH-hydrolase domains [Nocardioides psychrotolerans]